MARYLFDIETNGLLDTLEEVHCLVMMDPDTDTMLSLDPFGDIEEGVRALMEAEEIIGHNIITFDIPALQMLFPWFKPKGTVTDTLVCSRLIWPDLADRDFKLVQSGRLPPRRRGSHALEAWGYRLGEMKGEYGKDTHNTKDGDAWAEWNPEMQAYCEQDVRVTKALHDLIVSKRYSQQALDLEHRFAQIIQRQETHGFHFDVDAAQALYSTLVKRRLDLAEDLKAAFPPREIRTVFIPKVNNRKRGYIRGVPFEKVRVETFNPSSRQQIASRLIEKGWQPTEKTASGQYKVDETILANLDVPEAKLLAEHFLVEKRIGQLAEGNQAWLRLERKGRIHGSVNTNGAVTGRCTHSTPNVAQVPSVGAPYGEECRALFTVPKGFKLVGADLSGLELRCLAHYMARYDDGAYGKVLLEGDIHWANVRAMGLTVEDRDEERKDHKLFRNGAKTFIYGFLYGAGDEKAGSIVYDLILALKEAGLPCTDLQRGFFGKAQEIGPDELKRAGKRLKKRFLDQTPALRRLREDVQAVVTKRGHLIGLDGRKLHVRSQHAALNTLLQSAGALIAKQATVFLYDNLSTLGYRFGRDYALVAHVHDEVQIKVKETIADEVGKTAVRAMEQAGEHFLFRCPITGEYKIGNNWADTH